MAQKLNKVLILSPSNCFFGLLRRVMAIQVYFNGNNFGPDFILTEYLLYTSPQHSIINNPGPSSHLKAPSPIWFYSDFRYHHPHSTQPVIQPRYWILITQSLMAVKFRKALKTAIQNKYFLCTWQSNSTHFSICNLDVIIMFPVVKMNINFVSRMLPPI